MEELIDDNKSVKEETTASYKSVEEEKTTSDNSVSRRSRQRTDNMVIGEFREGK